MPVDAEASSSPFLPSDGLTIDPRSIDSYVRRRSYEGARWIKIFKNAIFFPQKMAEGAMIRFNRFLKARPTFRGERYGMVAGVCLLEEAHAWDFPVLEREVVEVIGVSMKAFRKKRRKMRVILKPYSRKALVNKYFNSVDLPMTARSEVLAWLTRGPSLEPRAAAGAAIYLGTRKMGSDAPTPETIADFMEITRTEVTKARKSMTRSAIP
jgi:transcription initiation factor TFIIIB Brf1 subunit/transcription initiation factor TFIIB